MSTDTEASTIGRERAASDFGTVFYPVFRRVFGEDSQFVANVEGKLAEARMATNVEMYVARALGIGLLAGVALWISGTVVGVIVVDRFISEIPNLFGFRSSPGVIAVIKDLKLVAVVVVSGVLLGSIGFAAGFGTLVFVPFYRAGERRRRINMLLPDAIAYMYALSIGGLNQYEILQAMARADDTYGAASEEFQAIVTETEYFEVNYRTAIRNHAMITPSNELSQFLIDMLSIIHSGGNMTQFLENQRDKHLRTAKKEQEQILETLELFGEMYMTLSLFPLLLVIIIVVMNMVGGTDPYLLPGTIYGLIPLTGVAFIVLVSTVTQDELGEGYLYADDGSGRRIVDTPGMFSLGAIEEYSDRGGIFTRIENREGTYKATQILKAPHLFFREYPMMTLVVTVPVALLAVGVAVVSGLAPLSVDGLVEQPVLGTFLLIHLPVYITFVPLSVFYEWNVRSRGAIVTNLSDELRKLASANGTGMTLLQSIAVVADTSRGKLAQEFETVHARASYGMSIKEAFRRFNNKYQIPRLARVIKLVSKAQETSGELTNVLTTAAQSSENQDDIESERRSRTMMQVVIIMMTYFTLLGVMAILKTQFLDVMAGLQADQGADAAGGGGALGANIDVDMLSMYFFHAVTLQAILSGLISGYMRSKLLSGVKFVIVLQTVALLLWMVIG